MITVLDINATSMSSYGTLRIGNSSFDIRDIKEINIDDTGKEFILYARSNLFHDIKIGEYIDKYALSELLSKLTIELNHARIDYTYTKDFVDWVKTAKKY